MSQYIQFPLCALFLSLILSGCGTTESDYEKQVRKDDQAIQSYLTENNIQAEKASSGVYVEPMDENGQGEQVQEDYIAGITYTITLLDGDAPLETYEDTLTPIRFSHSQNALIPSGLNYEIDQMSEGDTFRFYVPSYMAFGDYGHDDLFPPNSNFIMEVALVDLKTEEEIFAMEVDSIKSYIQQNGIEAESFSNGLHYVEEEEGTGNSPDEGDPVKFHFTRKYLDGTVIETTEDGDPISAYLDQGNLVPGLNSGIKLMRKGGEATLLMPSKLAFGKSIQVLPQQVRKEWVEEDELEPKVTPYTPVIYEVRLLEN